MNISIQAENCRKKIGLVCAEETLMSKRTAITTDNRGGGRNREGKMEHNTTGTRKLI
jgi:hypothetical protein